MKKIILALLLIATVNTLHAQISWKIKLGNKTILQTNGEDHAKNIARVKSKKIDAKAKLVISYRIQPDEKDWIRNVMIDDTSGAGILPNPDLLQVKRTRTEVVYTLPVTELRKLVTKHKVFDIWFTSIPSDPAKAAVVRVRKVHVARIDFSQRY